MSISPNLQVILETWATGFGPTRAAPVVLPHSCSSLAHNGNQQGPPLAALSPRMRPCRNGYLRSRAIAAAGIALANPILQ
jgi:hypothetical protein